MAATDKGVFYEGAFGMRDLAKGPAMTLDAVFRIASMTKAVTSVAALQLVEQSKLTLDGPVLDIDPARRPIALRHLLIHTAGFSCERWDADTVRYVKASGMPSTRAGKVAAPRLPLVFDPGERWEHGVNTDWVGLLVQARIGQKLDACFRQHIFGPLGMEDTGFATTSEQRARQASVHQRQADGSLQLQPPEIPFTPEFWAGGRRPVLDRAGHHDAPARAAARRRLSGHADRADSRLTPASRQDACYSAPMLPW